MKSTDVDYIYVMLICILLVRMNSNEGESSTNFYILKIIQAEWSHLDIQIEQILVNNNIIARTALQLQKTQYRYRKIKQRCPQESDFIIYSRLAVWNMNRIEINTSLIYQMNGMQIINQK